MSRTAACLLHGCGYILDGVASEQARGAVTDSCNVSGLWALSCSRQTKGVSTKHLGDDFCHIGVD